MWEIDQHIRLTNFLKLAWYDLKAAMLPFVSLQGFSCIRNLAAATTPNFLPPPAHGWFSFGNFKKRFPVGICHFIHM